MSDINLLPEAKQNNTGLDKVNKKLVVVTKFVGAIVLIGVLFYVGSFAYVQIQETLLTSSKSELENELRTLQPAEQKYTLLRDRVKKSGRILSEPSASTTSFVFDEIQKNLPEGTTIVDSTLKSGVVIVTLKAPESKLVGDFLRRHANSDTFERVDLVSTVYDPEQKYIMKLSFKPLQTN